MPDYTPADLAYFSANYLTLDELCADRADSPDEVRRLIAERRLPAPSYVLPDGTGVFPADYFRLVAEVGRGVVRDAGIVETQRLGFGRIVRVRNRPRVGGLFRP